MVPVLKELFEMFAENSDVRLLRSSSAPSLFLGLLQAFL